MNKRGLIGKILLGILIFILIIGIIIGVTAYRGYKTFQIVKEEQAKIQENALAISSNIGNSSSINQNCMKILDIEQSAIKIKKEVSSTCKNPIISIAIKKYMANKPIDTPQGKVVLSCRNLNEIYTQLETSIIPAKNQCSNLTK
jgi:hypothetical protein